MGGPYTGVSLDVRTIRRKPTTVELKYLLEQQLYHIGEDVVVDGRLLYELMREVLEWRESAKKTAQVL